MDFVCRQEKLQKLILQNNFFSSEATEELLSQLSQSAAIRTLQVVDLYASADFSSDAAAEACANFVANGLALTKFNIGDQLGDREITVTVTNATTECQEDLTDDTMGTVTVCNEGDGAVVCTVPTRRLQNQEVEISEK